MNLKIEFIGFPVIYDLFPEGSHRYTFLGKTLGLLVEDLINRNEPRVGESLIDPGTKSLDPTIEIIINRKLIPRDQFQEYEIEEGDHITFLKLLAGG